MTSEPQFFFRLSFLILIINSNLTINDTSVSQTCVRRVKRREKKKEESKVAETGEKARETMSGLANAATGLATGGMASGGLPSPSGQDGKPKVLKETRVVSGVGVVGRSGTAPPLRFSAPSGEIESEFMSMPSETEGPKVLIISAAQDADKVYFSDRSKFKCMHLYLFFYISNLKSNLTV